MNKEVPEQLNKEQKQLKERERILKDLFYELSPDATSSYRGVHPNAIFYLMRIERRDLAEEAAKVMLNDNLKIVLGLEIDKKIYERGEERWKEEIWMEVNHAPVQAASGYNREFGEKGINDKHYHKLAQGLLKLKAIAYELQKRYADAAEIYDILDMVDKADEMKSNFEIFGDSRNRKEEEDMTAFSKAVKDFQVEFANFPIMSKDEREQIIENIKQKIKS